MLLGQGGMRDRHDILDAGYELAEDSWQSRPPADKHHNYTVDDTYLSPDDLVTYQNNKMLLTEAILFAEAEVCDGIREASLSEKNHPRMRSEALYYFTSGEYHRALDYMGISTRSYPKRVWPRIREAAHLLMREYQCPVTKSEEEIVNWGHRTRVLWDAEMWRKIDSKFSSTRNNT